METPTPPLTRSDEVAFIKLVIEVELLRKEVDLLKHLVYVPNGREETIVGSITVFQAQLEQVLTQQRWMQGLGGAILVGVVIQIVQYFLKR